MKNLMFVLLCIPFFIFGQSSSPNMYEVVNIKVKRGMEDKFVAAVKSHNEKFHTDSLYQAFLTYNISGPTGGTYSWIMGPTNWGAMDTRPDEGSHNDDWKNVDQYVESYSSPSYWSYSEKLSHWVEGSNNDKRLIWAYNLERGKGSRWAELIGQVKEVYEQKLPDESFWVVWNSLSEGADGTDVCLIFGHEKWAEMDQRGNFGKLYEEVHGEGTWDNFLDEYMETVVERVDWTREVVR